MNNYFIGFVPPVLGIDGEFNTFRLGSFYAKRLNVGDRVVLLDLKVKQVIGIACVTGIELGQLHEMCVLHGAENHVNVGVGDAENAPERLFKILQKLNGPHIATPSKKDNRNQFKENEECFPYRT